MPRKNTPSVLSKICSICESEFTARNDYRGRKRETCSHSCASRRAYQNQAVVAECDVCKAEFKTARSVVSAGLPLRCPEHKDFRHRPTCSVCGVVFYADRNTTHLCSQECILDWQRSQLVETSCFCCGKKAERPSFTVIRGGRQFCSKRCNMRTFSRENPMRYGGEWPKWVRRIKDRDKVCQVCDSPESLQVHHFKKLTEFDNPNDSHHDENLVLLCESCHRHVEDSGVQDLNDFCERYSPTP